MFFLIVLVILLILIALLIASICQAKKHKHPYNYIPPHKYNNENID
jgi:hypothetical protein